MDSDRRMPPGVTSQQRPWALWTLDTALAGIWIACLACPGLAAHLMLQPAPGWCWWQIATAMLTHTQAPHLLCNMALITAGALLCAHPNRVVIVGLAGGMAANSWIACHHATTATLGASGVACAILAYTTIWPSDSLRRYPPARVAGVLWLVMLMVENDPAHTGHTVGVLSGLVSAAGMLAWRNTHPAPAPEQNNP